MNGLEAAGSSPKAAIGLEPAPRAAATAATMGIGPRYNGTSPIR